MKWLLTSGHHSGQQPPQSKHTISENMAQTRSRHGGRCVGVDPNRNWGHYWGGKVDHHPVFVLKIIGVIRIIIVTIIITSSQLPPKPIPPARVQVQTRVARSIVVRERFLSRRPKPSKISSLTGYMVTIGTNRHIVTWSYCHVVILSQHQAAIYLKLI